MLVRFTGCTPSSCLRGNDEPAGGANRVIAVGDDLQLSKPIGDRGRVELERLIGLRDGDSFAVEEKLGVRDGDILG